ncbi:MAG: hypothetical protein ACRDRU_01640 [Pseudonocardiaceae bacterium]
MNEFTIELPEGFVALPAAAVTAELGRALEELFHLPPGDVSAAKVAESLSALGLIAATGGAEYTSIGFFRSPDDPQRPVSVLLTAARMASDHGDPAIVIAGLRAVCAQDPDTDVQVLQLQAGPALAIVREEPAMIEVGGADPVPLLQRQVLAWIPDPAGSTVAVIGVASNSWQDWSHVCDLALDIFESVSWENSTQDQTVANSLCRSEASSMKDTLDPSGHRNALPSRSSCGETEPIPDHVTITGGDDPVFTAASRDADVANQNSPPRTASANWTAAEPSGPRICPLNVVNDGPPKPVALLSSSAANTTTTCRVLPMSPT